MAKQMTIENFMEKARIKHGCFYDYSKVEYKGAKVKVVITCPIHEDFKQEPGNHLHGQGCPGCKPAKLSAGNKDDLQSFLAKAGIVHGSIYDYSQVDYRSSQIKIGIGCQKHGLFWQAPAKHLTGQRCPKCTESAGEAAIAQWLDTNGILYEREKRFTNCRNLRPLPFDFYLPFHRLLIEFDGHYHFVPHFKKDAAALAKCQQNDEIKSRYCAANHLALLRIPYWDAQKIPTLLASALNINADN